MNTPEAESFSRAQSEKSAQWMIVDDHPGILQVLSSLVAVIVGAKTSCFESPAEALAAYQENPTGFQLVITDLEMPGMNGLELCDRMHAIEPRQKILLTTGNHAAMDEPTARLMGFCGLILKPFSCDDLRRVVDAIDFRSESAPELTAVPHAH